MDRLWRMLLYAVLGVLPCQAAQAAVIIAENGAAVRIRIVGNITPSDVVEVQRAVPEGGNPAGPVVLEVNSEGGDWDAAMSIGRILRASRATIRLTKASVCTSACVLLLAGATTRTIEEAARVGIHRPFPASTDPITFEQAQERYRRLSRAARDYLAEMNMPEMLWDAMVSTPPEKMRFLKQHELERMRLVGKDPALQDVEDADAARKYGITKSLYYRRKVRVPQECGALKKPAAYARCEDAVLRGGR